MRELKDPELLAYYLKKYKISSLFDTKALPFRLFEYLPGEMMNSSRSPEDYLKFVVAGEWQIYAQHADGSRSLIGHGRDFSILGDLEFCGEKPSVHWQEVLKTVHTLELPMKEMRPILMEDNRFLRFLLHNLARKMTGGFKLFSDFPSLEEKLLYYIRNECPGQTLKGIEEAAFRLHYSRRQLQRVLKDLTSRGVLLKV